MSRMSCDGTVAWSCECYLCVTTNHDPLFNGRYERGVENKASRLREVAQQMGVMWLCQQYLEVVVQRQRGLCCYYWLLNLECLNPVRATGAAMRGGRCFAFCGMNPRLFDQ
jgi:hypothetical protein